MSEENLICSFCNKSRKDVTKMIVGATKVAICNECIKLCVEILEEDNIKARKEKLVAGDKHILNPVLIKEHLDQYVIGQDKAKLKQLARQQKRAKRATLREVKRDAEYIDSQKSAETLIKATAARAQRNANYNQLQAAVGETNQLVRKGGAVAKKYGMREGGFTKRGGMYKKGYS